MKILKRMLERFSPGRSMCSLSQCLSPHRSINRQTRMSCGSMGFFDPHNVFHNNERCSGIIIMCQTQSLPRFEPWLLPSLHLFPNRSKNGYKLITRATWKKCCWVCLWWTGNPSINLARNRLDFRCSLESGLHSSLGRTADSFPEQRLVIEPNPGRVTIVLVALYYRNWS